MPVRAEALGARFDAEPVAVTARRILAYAAGTGHTDRRTFDDSGDLVAPPSFCPALEWPAVSGIRRGERVGLSAEEATRAVHVEQDSEFHRVIRPGDTVRTHGEVVAVRRTSAGAFLGMRLDTVDARTGSPVTTTWYGAIYRGVAVDGGDVAAASAPSWLPSSVPLDRKISLSVPREAAHVYTECSGIWNPIHTERRAAAAAGLPDIILHGTAAWAIAGRELASAYADADPARVRRLRARFAAPIVPGHPIVLVHAAASPGDVYFAVENAGGQTALAGGRALFAVERS
jgi:acyl dehydratase